MKKEEDTVSLEEAIDLLKPMAFCYSDVLMRAVGFWVGYHCLALTIYRLLFN